MTPGSHEAAAAAARGAVLNSDYLTMPGGVAIELPELPELNVLDDLPSALPSRGRGDAREKVLYNIAQDLGGLAVGDRQPDTQLWAALDREVGADELSKRVLGSVMRAQYEVVPLRRARSSGSPFLTPFHGSIPALFNYHGRYKSFRGSLLLYVSWNGTDFDLTAARALAAFLGGDEGLTLLDRELLNVAAETAKEHGNGRPVLDPQHLLDEFGDAIRTQFSQGAFDLNGLERVRRDLLQVLDLPLPRHDKVTAIIRALSLNLALYYYRLSYTLGAGMDAAVVAATGEPAGPRPDFTGRVRFRVGSGGDRPISRTAPAAESFRELDARHLLALPANIATANALHTIAGACGITTKLLPDPHAIATQLEANPAARVAVDTAAAIAAVEIARRLGVTNAEQAAADRGRQPGSGVYALREAILDSYRTGGNRLKQRGRDVVHTLVGGYIGGLKRNRGPVSFFELDEGTLELLVQLCVTANGSDLNFRDEFLPALASYGLAPQDTAEQEELAGALERLGLLRRYSDAGEALYVHA
jgi:hypothetical protein